MRDESWSRGQKFDRMAALAQFSGNLKWWESLESAEEKAAFAAECRVSPTVRLFSLDAFMGSSSIGKSIDAFDLKYRQENPPVPNEDY